MPAGCNVPDACDVLVVGGGPAGSSCAWKLRQAGADVIVIDRAAFPRDKVCAGWVTPQVIADLNIDCEDYRRGRTFQPIFGFRTGVIGGSTEVVTRYDSPVSFGIRRCEFDHYLLERSGARLRLGSPVSSIRRDGARWVINGSLRAAMLVGAGGHFCPVARYLNPGRDVAPLVVAHETEFPVESEAAFSPAASVHASSLPLVSSTGLPSLADDAGSWTTAPEMPELFFSRDLNGYGWCFRKGRHLNLGIGLLKGASLPKASGEFVAFLRARCKIPAHASWPWRGHAYLIAEAPRRRMMDAGVLLAGDAAGLAYPQSGEGIRPAIESGLLAASTIVEAEPNYSPERLESYEERLRSRFHLRADRRRLSCAVPPGLAATLLPWLIGTQWFTRHLVLDRWFLHMNEPALVLRRSSYQDDL